MADGLKLDPDKVKAIDDMPRPIDIEGVQRFYGVVNYLAKFLPKLSKVTEHIRQLTRIYVHWNWYASQENDFGIMKELVKEAPVLQLFDNNKPLMIQCDASDKGLGASLLQDGKPVDFASRAIVFSVEKFDQFTFGRTVHVQSDHKSLESFLKKPLNRAPKRLQSMMLRLQRCAILVSYVGDKILYLADTLSRAFKPSNQPSPKSDIETVCMIANVPMTEIELVRFSQLVLLILNYNCLKLLF